MTEVEQREKSRQFSSGVRIQYSMIRGSKKEFLIPFVMAHGNISYDSALYFDRSK